MITTVLCYSATVGSSVADYGTPCRVDMGNVGVMAIPEEEDVLPWKETSVESERLQFIERHAAGEETVAELCRRFGISRKTGYKLIGRYEAYGEGGLLDLSRAPHYHPNATPTPVSQVWVGVEYAGVR